MWLKSNSTSKCQAFFKQACAWNNVKKTLAYCLAAKSPQNTLVGGVLNCSWESNPWHQKTLPEPIPARQKAFIAPYPSTRSVPLFVWRWVLHSDCWCWLNFTLLASHCFIIYNFSIFACRSVVTFTVSFMISRNYSKLVVMFLTLTIYSWVILWTGVSTV